MSNLQRQRVLDLQQKLSAEAAAPRRKDATSAEEQAAAAMTLPRADQYRAALDDMIAGECPLCGDLMIKLVERPFLAENELDVVRQWEI